MTQRSGATAGLPRNRRTAAIIATLVAVLAVLIGAASLAPTPAGAAQISGAITNVTVTPPANSSGSTAINEDWCVPDGTQAGDTFSQTLPVQMTNWPTGFELRDPSGNLVATASISTTTPAIVTFTMTAYAETHQDVCGTATFSGTLSSGTYGGTTQTLTFTNSDGTTFTSKVPVPPDTTSDRAEGQKIGGFTQPNDQCRTNQTDCIFWGIQSPLGPFKSGSMSDSARPGWEFDCATAVLKIGNASGPNMAFVPTGTVTAGVVITCTPTQISATYGAVPAKEMVELFVDVNTTGGANDGAISYFDKATVKTVTSTRTQVDQPTATTTSSKVGGNGNGTQTPKIAIVKFDTADGLPAGDFDTAPGKALPVNTPTPITMTITNTGTEALVNVAVTDATSSGPALTGLSCDFSPLGGPSTGTTWAGPFAPKASFDCTGTVPAMGYQIQETDTATVTANGQTDHTPVTASNPWNGKTPTPVPAVRIVKFDTADGPVAGTFDTAPGKVVAAGTPVPITMTITNSGSQEPLRDITVTDVTTSGPALTGLSCDFSPLGGPSSGTTWAGPLAIGASFDCTGTVPAMAVGTQETDTATVTAAGTISGLPVHADNPWNGVTPTPAPAITIVKGDANGHPGDTAATGPDLGLAPAGVGLVYQVTNTGNEALRNVVVTDQLVANGTVTGLSCDFSALGGPRSGTTWAGPFAPGASFGCTAQLSGVLAGSEHEDIGQVSGIGVVSGRAVSASNPYFASAHRAGSGIEAAHTTKPAVLAFTGTDAASGTEFGAGLLLTGGLVLLLGARRSRRRHR